MKFCEYCGKGYEPRQNRQRSCCCQHEHEAYMFVMFVLALLTTTLQIIICLKVFNVL